MQRYRFAVYMLELGAVLSVLLAIALPWHRDHGTGFDVLGLALLTRVALGHPFDPEYIPISQWWLMWVIPLVCSWIGLRSFVGYIFMEIRLNEQKSIVFVLLVLQIIVMSWYFLTFRDGLEIGYWLTSVSVSILSVTVMVDMLLPDKSPEELRIERLPADHPDRLMAGAYKICGSCGEYNVPGVKKCRNCGFRLLPD